jgi:DNA-binding response OmpR family regulator
MAIPQRIIIAEDDPSIQKMFSIILRREGYEIEMFSDGTDVYEKKHKWPNLFILDRQLENNSDGLEACRHLKANPETKDIPILMISAQPGIDRLAKAAGAEDFLEKPFSVTLLLDKVRRILNRRKTDS